jgi:hypothetical protein
VAIDRGWLGQRGLDVSRAEQAMDRFLQTGSFRGTDG